MIRYDLQCSKGHAFDSWFRSSDAWQTQAAAGQIACPVCGDRAVAKALMAPAVTSARARKDALPQAGLEPTAGQPPRANPLSAPSLSAPRDAAEQALARLRAEIEARSDYVGMSFAAKARAMHNGETPSRPIHGEAKLEDARKLLEDGVPVAPLPFLPRQKAN